MRFLVAFLLTSIVPILSAAVDGVTRIRTSGNVTEYRLDSNQLSILLAPVEGATTATFCVTYRIGSRNESYGTTGATHLLEHMMFKGTTLHNKEAGNGIDQLLEGIGATTNATTWLDRTNYITTLSPEHLPVIIGLEADRMRNLRLRAEDLRPEMSVVWDEYDLGEQEPAMALDREIWATAFQAHPYRHSVIGWRSDIENIPLAKLREFYDTYYWPNQATVAVTGALGDTDALLNEIKHHYTPIPSSPHQVPLVYTTEPTQSGLRRFEMLRPGDANVLTIAFKSPPARDPDFPALLVLCDILADGQNSLFYEQLTNQGLTLDVTARPQATLDPSLLLITAEIAGETSHEKVEDAILDIIDQLIADDIDSNVVKTSIARLTAQAALSLDGSEALAETLTDSIAAGDWSLYQTHEKTLHDVTPASIRAAARKWLRQDRCTIGWYVSDDSATAPEPSPSAQEPSSPTSAAAPPLILPDLPEADPSTLKITPRLTRSTTAGIDLLICTGGAPNIIHLSGSIPAGTPADQPMAALVAAMIERGTQTRDACEIGQLLDESGSSLTFEASNGFIHFTGSCLSSHLSRLLSILADQLRHPSFPEEEFASIRAQEIAEAQLAAASPQAQAALTFNHQLYPPDHPSRLPDLNATIEKLQSLRREDLIAFHQKWFGPKGAILVITGDLQPKTGQTEVARHFVGWSGGELPPTLPLPPSSPSPSPVRVSVPGAESTIVFVGKASPLHLPETDALALTLATAALGDGFTSRLVSTVRDTEGLTYGVTSRLLFSDNGPSSWIVSASFAPELAQRGLHSIHREIQRWHDDGLSEREFAYRRNALIGAHRVNLSTTAALSETLHSFIRRKLPPEWIDTYPTRLQSLTRDQVNSAIRRHLDPRKLIEIQSGKTL